MIKLSDGQQVNAHEIKQVYVHKGEGRRAKWHTVVRLYDWRETYSVAHDTRDTAMQELEDIHTAANAQGHYIGVREE